MYALLSHNRKRTINMASKPWDGTAVFKMTMTLNTPFSPPKWGFILEVNPWVTKPQGVCHWWLPILCVPVLSTYPFLPMTSPWNCLLIVDTLGYMVTQLIPISIRTAKALSDRWQMGGLGWDSHWDPPFVYLNVFKNSIEHQKSPTTWAPVFHHGFEFWG